MAILDRPMFQRPLTKAQLKQYGLPAFANGGVVEGNTLTPAEMDRLKFQKIIQGLLASRTGLEKSPEARPSIRSRIGNSSSFSVT